MSEQLQNIKFNLTPDMSLELINFNRIKMEIKELEVEYNSTKDERVLIKLTKKEKELSDCKTRFIEQFKLNNQTQIKDYLEKSSN